VIDIYIYVIDTRMLSIDIEDILLVIQLGCQCATAPRQCDSMPSYQEQRHYRHSRRDVLESRASCTAARRRRSGNRPNDRISCGDTPWVCDIYICENHNDETALGCILHGDEDIDREKAFCSSL
jgi:hypothetical protein